MNNIPKERQLISRIHRLEGQVRSIERVLGSGDIIQSITQFEAVIAAAKAALNNYLQIVIENPEIPIEEKQKILKRLIRN